jgi:signal transduction histidine kinase
VELCKHELERMEAQAPALRWVFELNEPVPELVWLSRDATSEALANLLDNSRRHAESMVAVSLSSASGTLRISVHDDGPGLSDGARDSAFERFVSLDGYGGSGLGLPIARGLAEAQHGHLDYEGRSFVLTLPAQPVEPDDVGDGDRL